MTTHAHDERQEPTPRLVPRLRREARSGRPAFSPEFQARLVSRLAAGSSRSTAPAPSARAALPARWPSAAPLAAGLAIVSALALLAVRLPGPRARPPAAMPVERAGTPAVLQSAAVAAEADQPGDAPDFAILPLYDEIEAGLRAGARTLAESLVELPEWASLADFDAAAMLAAAGGP